MRNAQRSMPAISMSSSHCEAQPGAVIGHLRQEGPDLMGVLAKIGDEVKRINSSTKERLDELSDRQLDLEQSVGSGRRLTANQSSRSVGATVANSEALRVFQTGGLRGTQRIEVTNVITSGAASAGGMIAPHRDDEVTALPQRRMTVRSLLRAGQTTSNLIRALRQTVRTNAAAAVAEGQTKPESSFAWEPYDSPVRTIAHWVPVTRQSFEDAPQLAAIIDSELRYGLEDIEELQLVRGNGQGENLLGLISQASAYVPPIDEPEGATLIDRLRLALLQAFNSSGIAPTGILLHPNDWARAQLLKNSQQEYLLGSPLNTPGQTLWGLPVVDTLAMDEDEFLVGPFGVGAQIFDRMDAEVLISSEDRDNFIKNMLTVRAEQRLALVVRRPGAFIVGDFTTVAPSVTP